MISRLARICSILTRRQGVHLRQGVGYYLSGRLRGQQPGFRFQGREYAYFLHKYNHAWLGERTVEVPIARAWLQARPSGHRLLEVGNVLNHYGGAEARRHDVVDLHERAPGVINQDIATYLPEDTSLKYDSLLSISTLEHIGEDKPGAERREHVRAALQKLNALIASDGDLLATIPLGTGTPLEAEIEKAARGENGFFTRVAFLRRVDAHNNWEEAAWEDVRTARYDEPFPAANALAVCWREEQPIILGG